MRPIEIARALCPHARPNYLQALEAGDALFIAAGITTPQRLAHFLAQVFWESGGLTIEYENGNYSAPRLLEIFGSEPRRANGAPHHSAAITPVEAEQLARRPAAIFERVYGLGNPKKAHELGNTEPGDGFRYRGTGLLQTTGRGNFRRMGVKCNVDFEGHPELIVSATHALKPALAEWSEGQLNLAADRDDLLAITKKINGGTNGLKGRHEWLARIRPLIDRVTLDGSAPPAPAPAPKPEPSIRPHQAGGIGALIGGLVAALQADTLAAALGLLAIGVAIALIIYFVGNKKG